MDREPDRADAKSGGGQDLFRPENRSLPSLFVAHGAPSLVLGGSPYSRFLGKELPVKIGRPRAVAVFTAHWESQEQLIGRSDRYDTVHDFSGFPRELYQMSYPAAGDPGLSQDIADAFADAGIPSRFDSGRGLDHGVWAVLQLRYPEADIPVVPLAVPDRPESGETARRRRFDPRQRRDRPQSEGDSVDGHKTRAMGRRV